MVQVEPSFFPGVASMELSTEHSLSEESASLPSNATSSPSLCDGINVALEVWPSEVFNFPRSRAFHRAFVLSLIARIRQALLP